MNVCSSCIKFMTPLCHILPVHNITINTIWHWTSAGASFSWQNGAGFGIGTSHFKLAQRINTLLKWVQWPQQSEWEYAWHDSVVTFTAVISLPLPPILYV
jgi:hypothetical protein